MAKNLNIIDIRVYCLLIFYTLSHYISQFLDNSFVLPSSIKRVEKYNIFLAYSNL